LNIGLCAWGRGDAPRRRAPSKSLPSGDLLRSPPHRKTAFCLAFPRDVLRRGTNSATICASTTYAFRRQRHHALLVGDKGVGRTTVLHELARRSAAGETSFLANWTFLWFDCKHVGPDDSRGCLETILQVAEGKTNAVLCLDGLASLLKRSGGGSNVPLLQAAAVRPDLRILGTLTRWEYQEWIGNQAEMLDLYCRVDIEEPDDALALD